MHHLLLQKEGNDYGRSLIDLILFLKKVVAKWEPIPFLRLGNSSRIFITSF